MEDLLRSVEDVLDGLRLRRDLGNGNKRREGSQMLAERLARAEHRRNHTIADRMLRRHPRLFGIDA